MKSPKRFQKKDWLILAHKQIVREGGSGLTIESLCEAAQRTRGSFYHHFKTHEDFITQMMQLWVQKQTKDLITQIENIKDPLKRLNTLGDLATSLDHKLETAIRIFAQQNKSAAKMLSKVDRERVSYLKTIYLETASCDEDTAENIAKIEYAAFVGTMLLWPKNAAQTSKQLDPLFREFVLRYLRD